MVLPVAVQAQPVPDAPRPDLPALSLSMKEAVERAEAASPLIKRAQAQTQAVWARDTGAALLFPDNPVVSGYAGNRTEDDQAGGPDATGTQFGIQLGQEIEIGGQRSARRTLVKRAVDTAKTREQLARVETRARVKGAYVAGTLAREQVKSARQREDLTQQLLQAIQARVNEGAASDIDLRLAEVEMGQVEQERLEAEQDEILALAPLRILIGAMVDQPLSLTTRLGRPSAPIAPLADMLASARTRRIELRSLQRSDLELDAELAVLTRESIPNPALSVMFQRDLPGQEFIGAGLAIPLPVFRTRQGEKAMVRAARDNLAVDRTLTEQAIALEVETSYREVALLHQRMGVIENKILPAADASVALLREGWRAGKFDFFRVIQASREAWEARRVYFRTLGELWQATLELQRATGQI